MLKYYAIITNSVPRLISTTGEIPEGATPISNDDPLVEMANSDDHDKTAINSLIRQRIQG